MVFLATARHLLKTAGVFSVLNSNYV